MPPSGVHRHRLAHRPGAVTVLGAPHPKKNVEQDYTDKLIEVMTLDLSGPPEALRARLREIGQHIVALRAAGLEVFR